jgi:hypothetical protein
VISQNRHGASADLSQSGLSGWAGTRKFPQKITMKSHIQYSLVELCRRAAGITTAAAMFLSPAAPVLATPNNQGKPLNQNSLERLQHIIVIYQENWSFDSLYG